MSSSINSTLAIASQLIPSPSSTSALARRARRWAADPLRSSDAKVAELGLLR